MNDVSDIESLLTTLQDKLTDFLAERQRDNPLMIGIRTGGVWVAQRLHRGLHCEDPLGELNINFYRDDFTRIGLHPQVQPSNLETDLNDRHIVLVDDVLQTGRTIRAAMNEIFDFGRPASITLAVLIDRSGHELPIQADVTATRLELSGDEQIKLSGPEPLRLELKK